MNEKTNSFGTFRSKLSLNNPDLTFKKKDPEPGGDLSHNFPQHSKIGVEFLVFEKYQKGSFLSLWNTKICLYLPN